MLRLQPHTEYELIYRDGSKIRFRTQEDVPEAKHLIKVEILTTQREVHLVTLLERPWLDIRVVKPGE